MAGLDAGTPRNRGGPHLRMTNGRRAERTFTPAIFLRRPPGGKRWAARLASARYESCLLRRRIFSGCTVSECERCGRGSAGAAGFRAPWCQDALAGFTAPCMHPIRMQLRRTQHDPRARDPDGPDQCGRSSCRVLLGTRLPGPFGQLQALGESLGGRLDNIKRFETNCSPPPLYLRRSRCSSCCRCNVTTFASGGKSGGGGLEVPAVTLPADPARLISREPWV